jgi:hypothetical protein
LVSISPKSYASVLKISVVIGESNRGLVSSCLVAVPAEVAQPQFWNCLNGVLGKIVLEALEAQFIYMSRRYEVECLAMPFGSGRILFISVRLYASRRSKDEIMTCAKSLIEIIFC